MQATECPPHWWQIEPSAGPTSRGECKYCHAVRDDFANSTWDVAFKVASRMTQAKDARKDGGDHYPNGDAGWTR